MGRGEVGTETYIVLRKDEGFPLLLGTGPDLTPHIYFIILVQMFFLQLHDVYTNGY